MLAGAVGLGGLEVIGVLLSCYLGERINRAKNYQRLQ